MAEQRLVLGQAVDKCDAFGPGTAVRLGEMAQDAQWCEVQWLVAAPKLAIVKMGTLE